MYKYTCEYCYKEYIPKRRGVQKYCSPSCRSRSHQIRKKQELTENPRAIEEKTTTDQNLHKSTINLPDVANSAIGAAAGLAAYDGIKSLFTSPENKPATVKDVKNLIENINGRFQPVKNAPKRNDGTYAFYDREIQSVIYLPIKQ